MEEFKLQEQPYIEMKIRAFRAFDGSKGKMDVPMVKMNFAEDAHVSFATGNVVLQDKTRPYTNHYMIPIEELWEAFQRALNEDPKQRKIG